MRWRGNLAGWQTRRLMCVAALCLASAALAAPMQAPNSRVTLDLPEGYVAARTYSGFQHDDLGVSYLVQEMPPAAYDEIARGFTPDNLAARGFRDVRSARLARGEEHLYLRGRQLSPAGEYAKFIMVLRAPEATVLVTANVPELALQAGAVKAADVEAVLATAVVGATIERRELYRLAHAGPFKPAGTLLGTATLYTRDGRMEPEVKGRARSAFIVAPSLDQRSPPEIEPFALELVRSLAGFRDVKAGPARKIVIAGLEGVVHEAEAVHASDGVAMRIVQAVLVPALGGYYRLVGLARADEAEALLPEFHRMIEGFRLVDGR
jgi:hypothetical protein